MAYYQFISEDGETRGSFEVFEMAPGDEPNMQPGWYWAAGFPGCLWDGEPSGPFPSEQEAIDDAHNAY